jgi:hypothetical protein
VARRAVVNE